jgi:hypothetical protein
VSVVQRVEGVLVWPSGERVDFDSIEAYTEEARAIAHPLDDREIRTPDWAMQALAEVSRWSARMIIVIAAAEELKREASTELAEKKAQAVIDTAHFPAREQASRVLLKVIEERRAYDRAVIAFEKARRVGNLLSDYTGRVQSIANLVKLTYTQGGA